MTKTYHDKDVQDWNVNDFIRYMDDLHQELFGLEYLPHGSWSAERGRIGRDIGTQRKAGKYDKEVIKRFIDHCFKTYQPSVKYPGTNYGFCATYRRQDLQRIILAVEQERKENEIQTKQEDGISDEVIDWFGS